MSDTASVVAVDIGGTHARFALARVAGGRVVDLGPATTLKTAEYASFQTAWEAFGQIVGPLPRAAAIAVAAPITGETIKLTNNPWVIRPPMVKPVLGVDAFVLVNDFAAVAHTVAQAPADQFSPLCGGDTPLPATGTLTVVGPGTGLGVAQVWRDGASYRVQPTEGGHADFAPLDAIEDAMLARLRARYRRVSVERIVAGPGLVDIYETLAAIEGRAVHAMGDRALWALALAGEDSLANAALERFCQSLGSIAGDLALAHGAAGVVIAGGLGFRIREPLQRSGFGARFRAKGRFEGLMARLPVKLITHPEPGLFGAAAAFARGERS